MSKKPILYNLDISPPVRSVKTVAKLIGLELEIRNVDFFNGEHLNESFIEMNPEHTLPTLDDNGFIICDSQAICTYLVEKYAHNDQLYPKDIQLRTKCNERLIFNAAALNERLRDIGNPIYFKGCTEIPQSKVDSIATSLELLEALLAKDPFLVGQNYTIADICAGVTVLFLGVYVPIKPKKFPKIVTWQNRINQTIPLFDEMNGKYTQQHAQVIHSIIEKNKQRK